MSEPPRLTVTQVTDLTEGQQITVTGAGFRPGLKQVAVGVCREGYTSGPKDCDLDGGAAFVNVDAQGRLPEVKLTVHAKFKGFDCTAQQCVVGVAPLPGSSPDAIVKANTAVVNIGFQGSAIKGGAVTQATAAPTAADPDHVAGPSTALWSVTLGVLLVAVLVAARFQSYRRLK